MINKQQLTKEDIQKVKYWYEQLDTWPVAAIERYAEDYYSRVSSGDISVGEKRFIDLCLDYFINDKNNEDCLAPDIGIVADGDAAFFVLKNEMVVVAAQYTYDYNKEISKDNLAEFLLHPQDTIREYARLFYKDLCDDSKN